MSAEHDRGNPRHRHQRGPVRDIMDEAIDTALNAGLVEQIRDKIAGHILKTMYLPDTPAVGLRRRVDRELDAALSRAICGDRREPAANAAGEHDPHAHRDESAGVPGAGAA